jgi:hypothetical protein
MPSSPFDLFKNLRTPVSRPAEPTVGPPGEQAGPAHGTTPSNQPTAHTRMVHGSLFPLRNKFLPHAHTLPTGLGGLSPLRSQLPPHAHHTATRPGEPLASSNTEGQPSVQDHRTQGLFALLRASWPAPAHGVAPVRDLRDAQVQTDEAMSMDEKLAVELWLEVGGHLDQKTFETLTQVGKSLDNQRVRSLVAKKAGNLNNLQDIRELLHGSPTPPHRMPITFETLKNLGIGIAEPLKALASAVEVMGTLGATPQDRVDAFQELVGQLPSIGDDEQRADAVVRLAHTYGSLPLVPGAPSRTNPPSLQLIRDAIRRLPGHLAPRPLAALIASSMTAEAHGNLADRDVIFQSHLEHLRELASEDTSLPLAPLCTLAGQAKNLGSAQAALQQQQQQALPPGAIVGQSTYDQQPEVVTLHAELMKFPTVAELSRAGFSPGQIVGLAGAGEETLRDMAGCHGHPQLQAFTKDDLVHVAMQHRGIQALEILASQFPPTNSAPINQFMLATAAQDRGPEAIVAIAENRAALQAGNFDLPRVATLGMRDPTAALLFVEQLPLLTASGVRPTQLMNTLVNINGSARDRLTLLSNHAQAFLDKGFSPRDIVTLAMQGDGSRLRSLAPHLATLIDKRQFNRNQVIAAAGRQDFEARLATMLSGQQASG